MGIFSNRNKVSKRKGIEREGGTGVTQAEGTDDISQQDTYALVYGSQPQFEEAYERLKHICPYGVTEQLVEARLLRLQSQQDNLERLASIEQQPGWLARLRG